MGQEFTIKSEAIESKINQLLPSQGGYGAGIDFSASTTVIPIVDLTETAEGSQVRQDLQSSFSFVNATTYSVNATTTVLANTPGYYRVFGSFCGTTDPAIGKEGNVEINDGLATKKIYTLRTPASATTYVVQQTYDLIVYLTPGDSLQITADNTIIMGGASRQIADASGNLV